MVAERQPNDHGVVCDFLVTLGDDLVLAYRRPAPGTPGHHIVALVDPPLLMTTLKKSPDRIVVLVRHREVRVVPIHPVAQSLGLLSLNVGKVPDAIFARLDELGYPKLLNVAFRLELFLFFNLHFHPEALTIKPVLIAGLMTEHSVVAVENILVGAAPDVMHTHRIVSCDGAVDERPLGAASVLLAKLVEDFIFFPPHQQLPLGSG